MNTITHDSLVDIEFRMNWKDSQTAYEERFFTKVNLYRDIFPFGMSEQLIGKKPGDVIDDCLAHEKGRPRRHASKEMTVNRRLLENDRFFPRYGRFYPCGLLSTVTNVFPQNKTPFRVTGIDNGSIRVDLNTPMAGYDFSLQAKVHDTLRKPYDRGGECSVLLDCLTDGPGMQVRANDSPTDFFSDNAFKRLDETADHHFYRQARLVNHIDSRAAESVSMLYGKLIQPGMSVLDLMSSWRSHVPDDSRDISMAGLGMNADEMRQNPRLNDFCVHDLNRNPKLPYPDHCFDLVICTASVEYLIHPDDVFADIARVLRPNGIFAVIFSNRWFPPKAIQIWSQLHEFERMGLVLEYFHRSRRFTDLNTFSSRGWPRPRSDKYYPRFLKSDPVYAVWGKSKG